MATFQTINAGGCRSRSRRTCAFRCATASNSLLTPTRGADKPRPALVALSPYGKELQADGTYHAIRSARPSPMWDGCIEAGDIARIVKED